MFVADLFAALVPVVPFALLPTPLRTLGIAAAAGLAGVAVGALFN